MRAAESWADAVERRAEQDPDGELIRRFGGPRTTAGQLLGRALEIAGSLTAVVGPGDVVATAAAPGPEAAALSTAISWIGGVELPVPVGVDPQVVVQVAVQAGCRLVVADPDRVEREQHLLGLGGAEGRAMTLSGQHPSLPALEELARPTPGRHRPDLTDPACIMLSSGTGGRPRGALLPVGTGLGQAGRVSRAMEYDSTDVLLNVFAWEHVNARHAAFLPAVLSGARLVVDDFSASRFWSTAAEEQITTFNFMGAMCVILLRAPECAADSGHPVTRAYGGPAPSWLWHAFRDRFGVTLRQAYACTELGDVATTGARSLPGAAGQVVPEYDVQVVDGHNRPVPPGTVGRLLARPTARELSFTEYVGDAEATASAWGDGWFRTGDRAKLVDGWLFHEGRESDVIRRRGLTVDAQYVERVVETAEGVAEAAAIGVPSDLTDDDVLLIVVPTPGVTLDVRAVHSFCEANLPRHAVPRYVSVEATLPRTTTLKVLRQTLRERGVPDSAFDSDPRATTGTGDTTS